MAPAIPASPHGENFAEVVVVRHGQTESNVSGTVQGRLDHELNETGRQQAAMVARRLSQEAKPAAVYSSDLKRAAETAQTIAATCCVPNLVLDEKLTERHMGSFQGMKKHDAIKTDAYKAYSSNNDRNEELPGDGESLNQLSERCVPCLNSIAEKHEGERVVVVTHEEVIQEICRHADPTSSARRKIPNTSITVVHISGSDGGHWILEKVGDISHLMPPLDQLQRYRVKPAHVQKIRWGPAHVQQQGACRVRFSLPAGRFNAGFPSQAAEFRMQAGGKRAPCAFLKCNLRIAR